MGTKLNLMFPTNYEVKIVDEFSIRTQKIMQIDFDTSFDKGFTSIFLHFTPVAHRPWIGKFSGGYNPQSGITGVYSSPAQDVVFVSVAGQGYMVQTNNPNIQTEVFTFPIIDIRPVLSANLLIFSDFNRLAAYGLDGLVWYTKPLSWDGLSINHISGDLLKGTAWDAPMQKTVEFIVDLKTGNHQGGSSSEMYIND